MRVERFLAYVDILLLSFAIGINAYAVFAWFDAENPGCLTRNGPCRWSPDGGE